jgi:hypothetical protein
VTGHSRAEGSLCVFGYMLLRLFISADSASPLHRALAGSD